MRQFTVEVMPKFPARIDTAAGIKVTKANGVYTFSVDFDSVGRVTPPPAGSEVLIQLPDGSYATATLTDVAAANFPVAQTGKRNALINGGFGVWQRNTTFAPTTVRMLTADRWAVKTGAGTLTSVVRGAPTLPARAPYVATITGNASVTTVDIDQRLEAGGLNYLKGPVTFSALVTNTTGAAFTPTLFVETPTALDTWTTSAVQNNAGAGDALQSIASGTTLQVTWSANISAYANIANGLAFRLRFPSGALNVNTKSVSVSEVQVEPVAAVGDPPGLFEVEAFSDALARCQRYYQKSFDYSVAPAQNAGSAGLPYVTQAVSASGIQYGWSFRLMTTMRGAPTIVLFNPSAASNQARNDIAAANCTGTAAEIGGTSGFEVVFTTAAGSAVGQRNGIHYTADAEL